MFSPTRRHTVEAFEVDGKKVCIPTFSLSKYAFDIGLGRRMKFVNFSVVDESILLLVAA